MSAPSQLESAEQERQDFLAYEGNDCPRFVIVMWVVALSCLAAYTWIWYLPSLWAWLYPAAS